MKNKGSYQNLRKNEQSTKSDDQKFNGSTTSNGTLDLHVSLSNFSLNQEQKKKNHSLLDCIYLFFFSLCFLSHFLSIPQGSRMAPKNANPPIENEPLILYIFFLKTLEPFPSHDLDLNQTRTSLISKIVSPFS